MAYAYIEFIVGDFPDGFVLGINQYKESNHYQFNSYIKPRNYTMIELFIDEEAKPEFSEEWMDAFVTNCEILLEHFALAMENISPSEVNRGFDRTYWSPSRKLLE